MTPHAMAISFFQGDGSYILERLSVLTRSRNDNTSRLEDFPAADCILYVVKVVSHDGA